MKHPNVEKTYFPGLSDHPGHALAKKQMRDFGGMISIRVRRGKVELQAGLRAEYAMRDFSLEAGDSYSKNYMSLFPSGLISYKVNDKTVAKASYSRRIRRPGTQELNPFPAYFDVNNVFMGNPDLGPEYTDAIEFGLLFLQLHVEQA